MNGRRESKTAEQARPGNVRYREHLIIRIHIYLFNHILNLSLIYIYSVITAVLGHYIFNNDNLGM